MDTIKLEYFIRVCECGNLTKAAQSLFISQPALSQAISALERELNCELFYRDKKKLTITEQGQLCLKYARQITETVRAMQDSVISGDSRNVLRVSSNDSYFYTYLVSWFLYSNPNYSFTADYSSEQNVKELLRKNQADICITAQPVETDDLVCHAIFNERTYVIVPPDSPFYGKRTAYLREFEHYPFLRGEGVRAGNASATGFRNINLLNAYMTAHNIHLDFQYIDSNYLTHLWNRTDSYMLTSSLGLLSDKRTVPDDLKQLIRIEDDALEFNYYIVYKKECTLATHHFVSWLLKHAESLVFLT